MSRTSLRACTVRLWFRDSEERAAVLNNADLESAVAKIADMSEKLAVLNPPKDKAVYHAELLTVLQTAADWLETQYENTADTSDRDFSVILKSIEDAFRVSVN